MSTRKVYRAGVKGPYPIIPERGKRKGFNGGRDGSMNDLAEAVAVAFGIRKPSAPTSGEAA